MTGSALLILLIWKLTNVYLRKCLKKHRLKYTHDIKKKISGAKCPLKYIPNSQIRRNSPANINKLSKEMFFWKKYNFKWTLTFPVIVLMVMETLNIRISHGETTLTNGTLKI